MESLLQTIHTVSRDSPLSLSGRTCAYHWILLHTAVSASNHMICFCFLSCYRHDNPVYSCPQQQVNNRTPKQKGEFPTPAQQEHFASNLLFSATQEKRHASLKEVLTCRVIDRQPTAKLPNLNPLLFCASPDKYCGLKSDSTS